MTVWIVQCLEAQPQVVHPGKIPLVYIKILLPLLLASISCNNVHLVTQSGIKKLKLNGRRTYFNLPGPKSNIQNQEDLQWYKPSDRIILLALS